MGKRGPAPTPTALRELRGNPGKRALNRSEARPETAARVPAAPRWLSDEARPEWRRVAPRLWKCGLLTDNDVDALAMYCETWARWQRAERIVNEKGEVVKTANGNVIQNPYLSIANRARRDALQLMREFGMTPSSRSSIGVVAPANEPTLAEMLFKAVEQ